MQAHPLIDWPEPITQLLSFIGNFLAVGAVGFRYAVVRSRAKPTDLNPAADAPFYTDAARGAATLGLIGSIISTLFIVYGLPENAQRAHTTIATLLSTNWSAGSQVVLVLIAVIGFAFARSGSATGWTLALIGTLVRPIRGIVSGDLLRLVNPVHMTFAGLWIGTLFILFAVGFRMLYRDQTIRERRATIAADMVNSFSPLALFAAAGVATFGVITAWRHLHVLSNLWSTPYGYALLTKLVFVAAVVALGAWNWRRQRPRLGSEDAADSIRRSAKAELIVAGVVLCVTAVLVSLPSPRAPGARARSAPNAQMQVK
jgi:hypothetical protein